MKAVEEFLEGIREERKEVGTAIRNLFSFCEVMLRDVCRWRGRESSRGAGVGGCLRILFFFSFSLSYVCCYFILIVYFCGRDMSISVLVIEFVFFILKVILILFMCYHIFCLQTGCPVSSLDTLQRAPKNKTILFSVDRRQNHGGPKESSVLKEPAE